MTAPLKLSHNELAALLKSVFQACFAHGQDWAAMAQSVVWLESHGFDGLAMLMESFDEDLCLQAVECDVTETDTGHIVDLNGGSLILAAHMIADLALENSESDRPARLIVQNARQPKALIAALPLCASQGFDAFVTADGRGVYAKSAERSYTTYHSAETELCLTCGAGLNAPQSDIDRTAKAIRCQARQNLMDGLFVNHKCIEKLQKIADRFLVEATEASRKGAGE